MNFAIIGATGNVGRKTIEILEKSKIKITNLFLVASEKSEEKKLNLKEKKYRSRALKTTIFQVHKLLFLQQEAK